MATKLPYLNVLEVESVNKEDVSRAIVIDKDEYVKALDIEQITTYQGLSNKPKVNGVELDGDISLDELNVASKEDLNKVISDLEDITSDIPTSENIQDKIDDSLKNYPTKSDVTTEINNSITDKADKSEIPTKVSQLDNDEGFITSIPSEYVTEDELNDIISRLDIQNIPFLIVSTEPYEYSNYNYVGNFTDVFNAIQNNKPYLIYVPGGWMNYKTLANGVQIDNNTIRCVGFLHTGTEHYMSGWVISNNNAQLISNGFVVKNYVTSEELNDKQDTLVSGENIKTINNESILGSGNININVDLTGYATEQWVEDKGYLTSDSLTTINSDIDELETSKQEAFQVNQPLVFSRSGEDLVLDVNLDNYVTDTELDSKQDKLTPGDNINITDNVISWEAPDIQFVNTIFTDDESLKYTVSDFNGTSTEKTFPVATQTSAGLMSVADKTKLDNLNGSGGSDDSLPYLKVGLSSILSGDFTAVYNAIENDEAYFLQVPWSGGEIYGYFINPETVWASNNTIYCISQEHKSDGSFDQFNWTITGNSVTYTIDRGNAIPYLKVNNSTIVSGEFESIRNAIKQNHPYNILLYVTGTLDYFGPPELVRLVNDNQIECYTSYHPRDGKYTQTTWLINSDGSVTKTDRSYELVETYSGTSSLPQINVIRVLTQEEYDNLSEYDDYTQYIII